MNWLNNICCLTDSYKVSHWKQYPPGTKTVYSYFESREGAYFPETVFFGLQYFIDQYLVGPVVTAEKIAEAEELFAMHFGDRSLFNRAGWEHILKQHDGLLPVVIKAVPEGTAVSESNVLMTVYNTDPAAYWLTNYLETLLTQVWYPSTVATQSRAMRDTILFHLRATGDPLTIDYKLHDFGFRGVTCPEQAALGGAAHLVNFSGTDNIPALMLASKFYGDSCAGHSIPAAEHSTITSWGRENEVEACRNMLEQYPKGLVAVVSDSFDIYKCCAEIWGDKLRGQVLARDGVLVVRPDSGYPPEIVVKVLSILGDKFGFTTNEKGYKVLNPKVRVIQGDGIDLKMLDTILVTMRGNLWSADNISFGSGGGLLQKLNRDTQRFAFKCSAIYVNDEWRDVYKQPSTDGSKKSKSGRMKLIRDDDAWQTVPIDDPRGSDELRTVFVDGKHRTFQRHPTIRYRANADRG